MTAWKRHATSTELHRDSDAGSSQDLLWDRGQTTWLLWAPGTHLQNDGLAGSLTSPLPNYAATHLAPNSEPTVAQSCHPFF